MASCPRPAMACSFSEAMGLGYAVILKNTSSGSCRHLESPQTISSVNPENNLLYKLLCISAETNSKMELGLSPGDI